MHWLIKLYLALTIFCGCHLFVMASIGKLFGITVREISIGIGLRLLHYGIFSFRLIPFSGHVEFKSAIEDSMDNVDTTNAFDAQPTWKKTVVILSGPVLCAGIAVLLLGERAWREFLATFQEVLWGTLSPRFTGQRYLANAIEFIKQEPLVSILAVLMAKGSAFHLIPFPILSGGRALMLLANSVKASSTLTQDVIHWLMLAHLLVWLSWIVAIIQYLVSS